MNTEIEVKFLLPELEEIETRLIAMGFACTQARTLEVNERFDLPTGDLQARRETLRLRQDGNVHLTYKSSGSVEDGVSCRQEFELIVSDYAAMRRILEALGYRVFMRYEKFRCNYTLDDLTISLDEMPFGLFVELEGPSPAKLKELARKLGLDWEARINTSYLDLFETLKDRKGWQMRDLSFDTFRNLSVCAEDLGLQLAKTPQAKE